MPPSNTHPCTIVHITSKNTKVRKFQAFKWYGTQISLDMILDIRSQVKDRSRYGLEIFRKHIQVVQRLGIPSFVTIGRAVRELSSENPRELHHLCTSPVPARVTLARIPCFATFARTRGVGATPWRFQTKRLRRKDQ